MKISRVWINGLLAVAFVVISATFLHPQFEENDDPTMLMQVSGYGSSGFTHSHWIFASPLIGWGLKTLYRLDPSGPWYGLYLCALLSIITLLLFEIVHWSRAPLLLKILGGAVGLSFISALILRLQFTAVALGLGFLLIILFFIFALRRPPTEKVSFFRGALVGLTALIRTFAPVYVLIFVLPFIAFTSAVQWRTKLAFTCGLFSTWLLLMAGQSLYYASMPGWNDYMAFNSVRSTLHDSAAFKIGLESDDVLKAVGWSTNDREMFNHWFFTDSSVFSTDHLKIVAEMKSNSLLPSARDWFVGFSDLQDRFAYESLLCILLVLLICTYPGGLRIGLCAILVFLLLGACAVYFKAPPRIVLPVLLLISCSSQWVSADEKNSAFKKIRHALRWVLSLGIVGVLILTTHDHLELNQIHKATQQRFVSLLKELKEKYPATLYVWFFGGIELKSLPPFADLTKLPQLELLSPGWDVFSPDWNLRLKHLDLVPFEKKLSERSDIVVLAPPEIPELFKTFLLEHHQISLQTEILETPMNAPSGHIRAYRFGRDKLQNIK